MRGVYGAVDPLPPPKRGRWLTVAIVAALAAGVYLSLPAVGSRHAGGDR